MRYRTTCLAGSLASWCLAGFALAAPITTESLLNDLVDLQRLTRLPDPAYTAQQFSSYDRASKSPTEEWFANGDCGQFLRVEDNDGRKERVMMDIDGPGVVVRIWSANPKGVLRIYIDGDKKPAVEAPMDQILGGRVLGLPMPLSGERSRGWNLYFPFAYAKHCKVTADDDGFYYHVNYRTYPAGTDVQSYKATDLVQLRHKLFDVAARLMSTREDIAAPADAVKKDYKLSLAPGHEETIFEQDGAKAIVGFLSHISAKDIEAAARSVVVYMTFDGEKTVECPLGDFYGTAPGLSPYASIALGITKGETPDLWCHWWMPFAKSAQIRVKNLGTQEVLLYGVVSTANYKWDDRSMHFHAGWREEQNLPTRPMSDWTHLDCKGQGRFVGGALHIQNPVRAWWGEGDEKIYVDGETFPSTFGTGTEDYYGYAWCWPGVFVHAYHNQPRCDGPANYGNTSVNRFHIIDDIPFTKSFRFDLENWHWAEGSRTNRAAVSYWYARPGGTDSFKPITAEDVKLEVIPEFKVFKVEGALEGEQLKVIDRAGGKTEPQDLSGFGGEWSGVSQLWWTGAQPGHRLTVGFDAAEAGKKSVSVGLTKAKDYGIVQLYVNGQKAGNPIDLYGADVKPTGAVDLGEFDLVKGQNKLTAEIVGTNPNAVKGYMFGLDYILVK